MSKLIIHFVGKEKEAISYQDDDRLEDKLKDSIKDKGLKKMEMENNIIKTVYYYLKGII